MRRLFCLAIALCLLAHVSPAAEVKGRVIKVLPQLVDLKGRHALTPSLFDRDAYQAHLRTHPAEVSGIRFAVQWKSSRHVFGAVKLRVEVRGAAKDELPTQATIEQAVKPGSAFSHWAALSITGDDYKKLGEVTAWRVTLWNEGKLLGEQKSFLW